MPYAQVPVKMGGVDIGTARVNRDGTIQITTVVPNEQVQELLEHIKAGVVFGLSITPIINPGISGNLISRVDREKPLSEFGGFKVDPIHGEGNSLHH